MKQFIRKVKTTYKIYKLLRDVRGPEVCIVMGDHRAFDLVLGELEGIHCVYVKDQPSGSEYTMYAKTAMRLWSAYVQENLDGSDTLITTALFRLSKQKFTRESFRNVRVKYIA